MTAAEAASGKKGDPIMLNFLKGEPEPLALSAFGRVLQEMPKERRHALRAALKKAREDMPAREKLYKDAAGVTGLTTQANLYPTSLESPAMYLWTAVQVLSNSIPRRRVGGGQRNYRQVTNITPSARFGFAPEAVQGTSGRAGVLKIDTEDKLVTFGKNGADYFLTLEAQFGGMDDLGGDFETQDLAELVTLWGALINQELALLGGQRTALAAPTGLSLTAPTGEPAIVQPATGIGGLLNATTYGIKVTALTLEGWKSATHGNDGTSNLFGESVPSAEFSQATASGGSARDKAIAFGWNYVPGAVAYAVYAATPAGSGWKFQGVTRKNRFTLGLNADGTNAALITTGNGPTTADTSVQPGGWDGIYQLFGAQSGYKKNLAGAALTGDSTTGVAEFDAMFLSLFQSRKVGPSRLIMSAADRLKADKIILGDTSGPVHRIQIEGGGTNIVGSVSAQGMLNRYTGKVVSFVTHPEAVDGTIIGICDNLGEYIPAANVPNSLEMLLAMEMSRIDFSKSDTRDDFGVYQYGGLANRVPFANAILVGVGP